MPASIKSRRRASNSMADEITPLLASTAIETMTATNDAEIIEDTPSITKNDGEQEDFPLDSAQIFWVCFARIADPIAMFSIFPFVPSMVRSMDIPEENVGFYTGLIESIFSVVQMCTMIFWGRLADRYGRKPVLVVSSFGIAIFVVLFGMSKTIWQMILFRSMAGLFSGSVVAIRAMVTELSTKQTQARAFSYFAFASNIGIFTGPMVGALANPTRQYPKVFGNIKFFKDWPYILPTAVAGFICAITTLTTVLFVKETFKKPEEAAENGDAKQKPELLSTWEILTSPGVPMVIFIFCYAGLLGFAFTAVAPVFWFTSVPLGGFGFAPNQISLFFMISGISQALWLLLAFPPLQRRIGTAQVLRLCGVWWPIFILALPLGNIFLKREWNTTFWVVSILFAALGSGVSMAFTGVSLALNDVTPGHQNLGTLNSLGLTFSSGIRAMTPALFSSLYAYGVTHQILGGELGIVIIAILAGGFWVACQFLPKQVEDKPKNKDTDIEEQAEGGIVEETEETSSNQTGESEGADGQSLLKDDDEDEVDVRATNGHSK